MSAEISVAVDPGNPGQYFACCGMLELAHRMTRGVEGWFEGNLFNLRGGGNAAEFVEALRKCEISNTMTEEQKRRREELGRMGQKAMKADPDLESEKKDLDGRWRESPVVFGAPFGLQVDWFLDDRSGGKRFKTWAGQQSIIDIVTDLRGLIPEPKGPDWFRPGELSESVPLNFDSNLGGAGTDVDVGFSFDPLKPIGLRVGMRPTIELLAFVGLQRFRPTMLDVGFEYGVWEAPACAELCALAACGAVPRLVEQRYRFQLLYRTKYLKSFLPGRPV
jgi:CRISPR-associated protein Csb3